MVNKLRTMSAFRMFIKRPTDIKERAAAAEGQPPALFVPGTDLYTFLIADLCARKERKKQSAKNFKNLSQNS